MVEAGGEGIGPGVATGGVGAPAGGIHPLGAVTGSIDVDGKEQRVGYAVFAGNPVDPVHTLLQGDILQLGNNDFCIVPPENKSLAMALATSRL